MFRFIWVSSDHCHVILALAKLCVSHLVIPVSWLFICLALCSLSPRQFHLAVSPPSSSTLSSSHPPSLSLSSFPLSPTYSRVSLFHFALSRFLSPCEPPCFSSLSSPFFFLFRASHSLQNATFVYPPSIPFLSPLFVPLALFSFPILLSCIFHICFVLCFLLVIFSSLISPHPADSLSRSSSLFIRLSLSCLYFTLSLSLPSFFSSFSSFFSQTHFLLPSLSSFNFSTSRSCVSLHHFLSSTSRRLLSP